MKHLFYTALALALCISTGSSACAQAKGKFGYVNSQDILLLMPERADAEKALQEYARQLEAQLATMTAEYQAKLAEYQKNPPTDQLIRKTKEEEILQLQQRIETFRMGANEKLQEKESELVQPMADKINKAIEAIAKESGYSYIFDDGSGVLLYRPEGDDISALVKKKLGIQ